MPVLSIMKAWLLGVACALAFGGLFMIACAPLGLYKDAREVAVLVDALSVPHVAFAIFGRNVVSGLRDIPWLRRVPMEEPEMARSAAIFLTGWSTATLGLAFWTKANPAIVLIVATLTALALGVAIRRNLSVVSRLIVPSQVLQD